MKLNLLYENKKRDRHNKNLTKKTKVWQTAEGQDAPGTSSGPPKEGGPKKQAPAYEWPNHDGLGNTAKGWKKHQLS